MLKVKSPSYSAFQEYQREGVTAGELLALTLKK
jgi:hypothetical protein